MTARCHPLPASEIQNILATATRALCDRPGETQLQAAARTTQLVHATLGFEPRDALEYMLATLIVGQYHLILDAMKDVFHDPDPKTKQKSRTAVAALTRAMQAMIRDFRTARKRELADPEPDTAQPTPEPPPKPAATPRPAPAPSTQIRKPVLTLADFPPSDDPDDDAQVQANIEAFERAYAEAQTTLAEGRMPRPPDRGTPRPHARPD